MFSEKKLAEKNGISATISLIDWIKIYLISLVSLIPVVGPIILLVITCVLAFGDSACPSAKSYFQSMLIFSLILSVIVPVYLLLRIAIWGSHVPFF